MFLDGVSGDSGWLNCWEDDREAWHDNVRGASEYALDAGVQEYRTRVAAGNNGMNTTDADSPWVDPMATDPSDDSPSAIAIDTVTVVAQDEATSVVWGMPGAVATAGLCTAVMPLAEIGSYLRRVAARTAA